MAAHYVNEQGDPSGHGGAWVQNEVEHLKSKGITTNRCTPAEARYTCAGCSAPPNAMVASRPALQAVAAAGGRVLPIWKMSSSQWDTHIGPAGSETEEYMLVPGNEGAGKHTRADCGHYCEPSGVQEAIVDGVFALLL